MARTSDGSVIFSTALDESGMKSGLAKLKSSIGTFAKSALVSLGGVTAGLAAMAKQGMSYNSQMEQYTASFETMLGSAEAAQKKVAELKKYAADTPFEMTDLAKATQTMLGFGIAEEKAGWAMERMGDISQGNREKFSGLSLVYGQISSTGKLMGQDLLQLINQGFNPLTVLADKTGASMMDLKNVMSGSKTSAEFKSMMKTAKAEVKKLGDGASDGAKLLAQIGTEGMISAEMVDKAMEIATSAGGLYYKAMDKQAKTAAGMISTLQDNVQALGGDAFAGLSEAAKREALPAAMAYVEQMSNALRENGVQGLVGAVGDVLGGVVSQGASYAPKVIGLASELIKSLVGGLKKNAKVIAKGLGDTLKSAGKGLVSVLPDILGALGEGAEDLLPGAVDAAIGVLVGLCENADDLLLAGWAIVKGILRGVIKGVPLIVQGIGQALTALFTHNDEIEAAVDKNTAKMREAYTTLKKDMASVDEKYKTTTKTVESDHAAAAALLDLYTQLDAKEIKSDQDMAELAAIAESIKSVYPDIATYIDPVTGLFTVSTQAIRNNIQALKDQAMMAAALELVGEKSKQLVQAQVNLQDASGEASAARARLEELQAYGAALDALYTKVDQGEVEVFNLGAEFGTLIEKHGTLASMYTALPDGGFGLRDWIDPLQAQSALMTALISFQGYNDDAIATQQGTYDILTGTVNEYADAQVTLNAEIQKYITLSTGAGSESAKQAAEAKAAAAELEAAWGKAGEKGTLTAKEKKSIFGTDKDGKANRETFEGLMAAIPDLTASNADWVAWQTSVEALCQKVPALAEYLATLAPKAEEATDALIPPEALKSEAQDGPLTKAMKTDVDGAVTALETGKTSVKEKATALRDELMAGLAGGESESDKPSSAGAALLDGVAAGMENNTSIKAVAGQKVGAAVSSVRSTYGNTKGSRSYTMGQNLVDGIAAGAASKGTALNAALIKIVKNALAAAKAATGTRSPSRLFAKELGAPLGQGIEVGFLGAMDAAIPRMAQSIAESAKAGKAALDGTLLGRVSSLAGGSYANAASLGTAALRGSTLGALTAGTPVGGAAGDVSYTQNITFESTMQAPDEVARAIRRQSIYGLAGARV